MFSNTQTHRDTICDLWHLLMALTHRAKFKGWPYLDHLWTKLNLHSFWGCKTVSWKIGSMCDFSTLTNDQTLSTLRSRGKTLQAYIWVTRNFRIKMFQLFSYQKQCVCTSTSMKCFHLDFQRDTSFILILASEHFPCMSQCAPRAGLLSTAWGPHSLPGWPKATFSQQGRGSLGTCSSPQVNGENFETTQSLKSWNNTKILPAGSHLKLILIFNCEDISVACVFISSLSTVLSITKLIFTSPVLHSSPFFSNWRVLLKLCLLKHSTIVCDVL